MIGKRIRWLKASFRKGERVGEGKREDRKSHWHLSLHKNEDYVFPGNEQ